MAKRPRDYKKEYARRIGLGRKKGLTRSQARGHRKAGEARSSRRRAERELEDAKLQVGLRELIAGKSFRRAARTAQLSVERLRRVAIEKGVVEKRGRRWVVKRKLPRRVLIYSKGQELTIIVGDFVQASLVGEYMANVGWFLRTNERRYLKPFAGRVVVDIKGKRQPLETNPNTLYRLTSSGGATFEQVYRILV